MIEINVAPFLDQARDIAGRRHARAEAAGARWAGRSSLVTNVWGVTGELAVASWLGVPLTEETSLTDAWLKHFDVAGVQVRTRAHRWADLGLSDADCPKCIYVAVVPVQINVVAIAGAIRGSKSVRATLGTPGWVDSADGPVRRYWIPQAKLRPVPEQPPAEFYKGHSLQAAAA